jgi:uncharacterized protein YbjT (DUF2867 family)
LQTIFITGGTGYIGSRLIKALLNNGSCRIKALVRKGSADKLPRGCEIIYGDALDATTYHHEIAPATIFVHLVGVAHPSPAKAEQFKNIDLVSVQEAVKAATAAGTSHFIYLSVAMYPTKIMKEFQAVRAAGERLLLQQNFVSSFIRPWYVLGPGHWWPLLLTPAYWFAKLIPSKREFAKQLDTVTIRQMINCLMHALKTQPPSNTIYTVDNIKRF